jgi:NAD(P)-dependent dehydrogenase (short-subunit alcohol dehydrogenase family)
LLDGRRVLVVGASRGLGNAFVERLLTEGAFVAAAARSIPSGMKGTDHLHLLSCDVRDPTSCSATVDAAVSLLGGLDAMVYAPGVAVVTELRHATSAHWHDVLDTNVVGAALMTAAAIDHLAATDGIAVFFSSVSAHVTPPWIGMGLYAASKAALEKSVEVWKLEHPRVRFTTMVVGSTTGNVVLRQCGETAARRSGPVPRRMAGAGLPGPGTVDAGGPGRRARRRLAESSADGRGVGAPANAAATLGVTISNANGRA